MKAIIFDLFDTLVHIEKPTNPYANLFAVAAKQADPQKFALTHDMSIPRLAKELKAPLQGLPLSEIESAVKAELRSVSLYPDTLAALAKARAAGAMVMVSANMAKPYQEVRHLLDAYVDYWNFSFETGFVKPDPRMFTGPAAAYGLKLKDCFVVSTSPNTDGKGAAAAGMRFIVLDRTGKHPEYATAEDLDIAVSAALALD